MRVPLMIPALLGLALGSSCEPPTPPATRMMVLLQESDGLYRPHEVQVTTLTNVVTLEGGAVRLIGGARVEWDPDDRALMEATNVEQLRAALVKDEGRGVRAQYVDRAGVLWPMDFHSWNLATAYHHFERAAQYFRDTGSVPESALDPADVYYFPELRFAELGREPQRDNAMWFPPINALILLPFDVLQEAPLAINGGVLVHEYAHRVFNRRVYRGAAIPTPLSQWSTVGPTPGINILKALDEGFADFHAAAASCDTPFGCDTRFMNTSFDEEITNARDLAQESRMCASNELLAAVRNLGDSDFSGGGYNYQLGSIIASALWQAGQSTGQRDTLERELLDAYADDDPARLGLRDLVELRLTNQDAFTLEAALNTIVAHITDPTLQKAVCGELLDHAHLALELLPSCPSTTVAGTTCEVLP